MPSLGSGSELTIATTLIVSLIVIGIHYEALRLASSRLITTRIPPRMRVAVAVVVALIAHLFEVLAFAVALGLLLSAGVGSLFPPNHDPETVLYFSLICYTSLGFGEIVPEGPLRLLAGIEGLLGLVMIGWTASFTYLEMRMNWLSDRALTHQARTQGSTESHRDG